MKIRDCVYTTLFMALLLNLTGCNTIKSERENLDSEYNGASMLSLGLFLDKHIYKLNEPIIANVLLKNTGTDIVTVNARMAPGSSPILENEYEIEFVIETPSGKIAVSKGLSRIRMIIEDDFIVLLPRRGIIAFYNLQDEYTLDELGTYSVFVIYQNQLESKRHSAAWKGELKSNTITFVIEQ